MEVMTSPTYSDVSPTSTVQALKLIWLYTYPSEKYESELGLSFPNIWKNKKCSKPPTSYMCFLVLSTNLMIYVFHRISRLRAMGKPIKAELVVMPKGNATPLRCKPGGLNRPKLIQETILKGDGRF
jgi:hypothetical protein